jgi:tRNASer (uridine44-2'-O)-methyltransferase
MNNLINLLDLTQFESIDCDKNALTFEHSVKIYINKPQVINKWLAGSVLLDQATNSELLSFNNISQSLFDYDYEFREYLSKSNKVFQNLKYLIVYDLRQASQQNSCILFVPLFNQNSNNDETKYSTISFIHLFEYDHAQKRIKIWIDKKASEFNLESQLNWLSKTLLPKLKNWCLSITTDSEFTCTKSNTLTLYPNMINDYMKLYLELKELYWPRFASIWYEMTSTEPEKFIHEDISIAAYLILVWRHFNQKVECFVDLGCGNGLLVYILNDQGYNGYGVDMRKRKIWSNEFYAKLNVNLIERIIEPSEILFDKNEDWLVGNHSDELSPWLPVLAFKTSQVFNRKCNFFLIPCCLFDFNSKFNQKQKNESRNETYLNFLYRIGDQFGFEMFKDKLRIPSTKNACLIGIDDTVRDSITSIDSLKDMINSKIESLTMSNSMNQIDEFKARDLDLERLKSSRNCTKNVPQDLKIYVLKTVLDYLLFNENSGHESLLLDKFDGTKWNAGRQNARLSDIVALFDKELMSKLKLECGGMKTLLKNYHQVFQVFEKDRIVIRNLIGASNNDNVKNWRQKPKDKKDEKVQYLKTKNCLFDTYHPNGCLLPDGKCDFIHQKK